MRRNRWVSRVGAGLLVWGGFSGVAARADGLEGLGQFVRTARAGHAEFTQVVTSPGRDGQPPRAKSSSGTFDFSRPNRFRFIYRKPMAQTIVADGQTLWLYDEDLNQVTARKQGTVLASTPAALIASAADIKALEADFALRNLTDKELAAGMDTSLDWVLATPRAHDSGLNSIRVGLRKQNLAALDILDSFGQRSVLTFGAFQSLSGADAAIFQFKPPAGADVIRQ